MALDLLDTPLRVTWDLHGRDFSMSPALAATVAERLIEAGVFFVTLQETPLAHPSSRHLARRLAEGGCALQFCYGATPVERRALAEGVAGATLLWDVAPLFAAADDCDEASFRTELRHLRNCGVEPVVMLTPTRTNLAAVPQLLALCHAEGVGRIKLPNTRADDSFCRTGGARLPTPRELAALAETLRADPDPVAGLALEVHDLFLWEVLQRPGSASGRSEYGGCQAANSLAHVDGVGQVRACSSWPLVLGALAQASLAEVWAAPARATLRAAIAAVPAGCAGCRDYLQCFGGCRGLSALLAPDGDGRDPLCAGRRD